MLLIETRKRSRLSFLEFSSLDDKGANKCEPRYCSENKCKPECECIVYPFKGYCKCLNDPTDCNKNERNRSLEEYQQRLSGVKKFSSICEHFEHEPDCESNAKAHVPDSNIINYKNILRNNGIESNKEYDFIIKCYYFILSIEMMERKCC